MKKQDKIGKVKVNNNSKKN